MTKTDEQLHTEKRKTEIFYQEQSVSKQAIHDKIDDYCHGKNLSTLRQLKTRILNKKDLAKTTVVPVASGKGGVGKTNMVIALGLALHDYEWNVGIVDLDLTSNTHCLLGLQPYDIDRTLMDYLKDNKIEMNDIAHSIYPHDSTLSDQYNGVDFFPGIAAGGNRDRDRSRMVNYQQYRKLLRGVLKLEDYDFLLLDLPAGCSTSALTFYSPHQAETSDIKRLVSRSRLKRTMVLNYTPSSFEASRTFLDHAITRELQKRFKNHETVKKLIDQFKKKLRARMSQRKNADEIQDLTGDYMFEIIKQAAGEDSTIETKFQEYIENFETGIICNAFGKDVKQARQRFFGENPTEDDQKNELYEQLSPESFKSYFRNKYGFGRRAIEPAFLGYCPRDADLVESSEIRGRSFYVQDRSSDLSMQIRKITMQLQQLTDPDEDDESDNRKDKIFTTAVNRIDEHINKMMNANSDGNRT